MDRQGGECKSLNVLYHWRLNKLSTGGDRSLPFAFRVERSQVSNDVQQVLPPRRSNFRGSALCGSNDS